VRILVVDDNTNFRDELVRLLIDFGHAATAVPSSTRAIQELEAGEFDVMFTDLRMGRRSGIELLAEARERWPRLLVVMVTGHATVETAVKSLRLGAFDYLRKPIRPDQVLRVLELVGQQLSLLRVGAKPLNPARYAHALAAQGGYEVLLIAPPPVPRKSEKVSYMPLDPDNPFRVRDAVEQFVSPRQRAAVVLASIEELLARHREEEIAALLEQMRAFLQGKGPLAVGYDPGRITATGALAVRSSIVSADAHQTLESLGSPIRRLVLRRLADGPCSFTQAKEAAHIDDTSKIAFHLRKLTESGLVTHLARERYQLTARGRGAIEILGAINELDSTRGSGNRVFVSAGGRAPPARAATRRGRSTKVTEARRDRPTKVTAKRPGPPARRR
jgi:CheY-like chemotaxis protein/DNA-binding transcriptional ArsR family regulator